MQVKVLLFGPAAAAAGCDSITVSVMQPASGLDVLCALGAKEPRIKAMTDPQGGARLAVNHSFVAVSQEITARDEVALITMVSGG